MDYLGVRQRKKKGSWQGVGPSKLRSSLPYGEGVAGERGHVMRVASKAVAQISRCLGREV